MKALRVHGGGAVLERISERVGAFINGEAVRGMAKLAGLDMSMTVSESQSTAKELRGDCLGEGINRAGEGALNLEIPIIELRGEGLGLAECSEPGVDGLQASSGWPTAVKAQANGQLCVFSLETPMVLEGWYDTISRVALICGRRRGQAEI